MMFRSCLEQFLYTPPAKVNIEKLSKKIKGKNVLITGASKGIGASIAYLFAKAGANLFLVARNKERLVAIKKVLEKSDVNVQIFAVDLMDLEKVKQLVQELNELSGGIDIFISNAGKSIHRSFFNSLNRFHDFERTMNLNYFAPVLLMLSLYNKNSDKQGIIVNISTVAALIFPTAKWAAYQSSKVAFDHWFRSVGAELRTKKISTISIYLPLVRTTMISPTKKYRNKAALSSKQVAMIVANKLISNKRHYKPWWAIFAQLGSVLFSGYLERYSAKL